MKKFLLPLLILIAATNGHCESFAVDWAETAVDTAPEPGKNHLQYLTNATTPNEVVILDRNISSVTAFPEGERALKITQGSSPNQKAQSAIAVFDFSSAEPLMKGSFTISTVLLPSSDPGALSGYNIVLAPNAANDLSQGVLTTGIARIRLTGNFGIQLNIPAANTESIGCQQKIVAEKAHDVRIDWDLTASPAYCTVHVDGQPVSAKDKGIPGEATHFLLGENISSGVGAIMIMPRTITSSYLIGRMEMSPALP